MDLGLRWSLLVLLVHLSFSSPAQSQRPLLIGKVAAVQLDGGERPSEGNVLVTSEAGGGGRPLCDDFFGMTEANAVCRALGYPRALRFTRRHFFGGHTQRWTPDDWKDMYLLECPEETGSSNVDLTSCTLSSNTQYCTGAEVAGVECQTDSAELCSSNQFTCEVTSGTTSDSSCISEYLVCNGFQDCMDGSDEKPELCEEDAFRLESVIPTKIPGNSVAGTVYMKHNGTWSTVCDDLFGRQEAKVICRNLGYGSGMSVAFTRAYFGEGTGDDIGVDNLECTGEESSLSSCPGFLWGESDCAHAEDAGVFCHDGTLSVQLVEGSTQGSGRVEVRSSTLPSPASICDEGFDDLDAQVICRMLGYAGNDAIALRDSHFGPPTGEVWNIILDCVGSETTIQDCRIRVANRTCTQRHTASVACIRGTSVDDLLSRVLPSDCGEPLDASEQSLTGLGKVRGGRISSRYDVPWLASLRVRSRNGYTQECGAVMISEDYILSAAHCFELQGKLDFIVSIGDFNTNFDDSSQQDFFIDKLWLSELFEETGFGDNDIALIKIERKHGRGIRFGGRVKPICLPKLGETYENLHSCNVTGWGVLSTSPLGQRRSLVPRTAEIGVLPDDICEGRYGTRRFSSSSVCFGKAGFINPCAGDSGGPLTCKDQQGRHVLYGIVSVGKDCIPRAIFPNIYTRVTKYLRWIQETIYKDLRLSYPFL
ncbi:neurotrypsin-like isoform X2 [Macrobrachium rosenbergii]|uniref:neurotrypsin-like isoform X2 n=1 Tax=Macrobrachium rosenbergii TaxID=79674 RepID=UPI0034D4C774